MGWVAAYDRGPHAGASRARPLDRTFVRLVVRRPFRLHLSRLLHPRRLVLPHSRALPTPHHHQYFSQGSSASLFFQSSILLRHTFLGWARAGRAHCRVCAAATTLRVRLLAVLVFPFVFSPLFFQSIVPHGRQGGAGGRGGEGGHRDRTKLAQHASQRTDTQQTFIAGHGIWRLALHRLIRVRVAGRAGSAGSAGSAAGMARARRPPPRAAARALIGGGACRLFASSAT